MRQEYPELWSEVAPSRPRVYHPRGVNNDNGGINVRLEVESGRVIDDVAEADLRELITGEDFAILGDALHYMQCAEESREPRTYILEYQDGALDRHFRALEGPFSLERVVAAFGSYMRGDGSWKQSFTWTKVEL